MNIWSRTISIVMLSVAGIACSAADDDEDAVRAEIDSAVTASWEAYAANDVERYFSYFADDAILIGPNGQEQSVGEYYEQWKSLIAAGGGISDIDVNFPISIRLSADANTAVVHYVTYPVSYRFLDESDAGGFVNTTFVWAMTDVWSRTDGRWKIVHNHFHEPTSNGDDE